MSLNKVKALCSNEESCFQKLLAEYFKYRETTNCGMCKNWEKTTVQVSPAKRDMSEEAKGMIVCLEGLMNIKPRVTMSDLVLT